MEEYDEINGELFFKETHLHELLKLGRSQLNVKIETLMMVDSFKMSKSEKNYICCHFPYKFFNFFLRFGFPIV